MSYEIHGVDVSHYQGEPDYDKFIDQDVLFVLSKSSEGAYNEDITFGYNWKQAAEYELLFGAYHFVRSAVASSLQVDNIKHAIGERKISLLALDCEDKYATPMTFTGILVDMLRRLEGYYPLALPIIIYTRAEWWKRIILDVGYPWEKHPLWVAQYKTEKPTVPKPWKTWTIWQYGQAAGAQYGVDPLQNKLIDVNQWNPAVAFPGAAEPEQPGVTVTGTITINGVDYQLIKKE